MTAFGWFMAIAVGLTSAAAPSLAAAFDAQAAKKTCLERFEHEREGGTIPGGMAKSRYLRLCVGSMRQSADLEKELAAGGTAQAAPSAAGSNELPASTGETSTKGATSGKPAAAATPAFAPAKGQ